MCVRMYDVAQYRRMHFLIVFKINKCMNGFAQYLSLDLPQVPHKNIHKRRRDAGEACKKVKRQKSYKYIFIIIISTGCNIKTMSKLLQNYSSISNSYA